MARRSTIYALRIPIQNYLQPWFDSLQALKRRIGVLPSNTWNIDETGIALSVCSNQRVIGSSHTTQTYIQTPENREWVSIIECISASGKKITPVVIFKGQSLQTSWFTPDRTPNFYYTTSENGWTSNTIGLQWLQKVFLPFTDSGANIPYLLILDNYSSHITVKFIKFY